MTSEIDLIWICTSTHHCKTLSDVACKKLYDGQAKKTIRLCPYLQWSYVSIVMQNDWENLKLDDFSYSTSWPIDLLWLPHSHESGSTACLCLRHPLTCRRKMWAHHTLHPPTQRNCLNQNCVLSPQLSISRTSLIKRVIP